MSLAEKFQALVSAVSATMIEREAEVRAIILGLLAREHVLLIGIPGIAKSHLCRSIRDGFDKTFKYREFLLTGTTDDQTIFGPIDMAEFRSTGKLLRMGEHAAQSCHLLFLDEFFRAGPCVADGLLHILGPERQTLVDGEQVTTPLISAIGASNSVADSADQQAIFDRWLIRRVVETVSRAGIDALVWSDFPPVPASLTLAELQTATEEVKAIPVGERARENFMKIVNELHAAGIQPSPRRLRASAKVARAHAWLEGHAEIETSDFEPLVDVLWDQVGEQADKAAQIILQIANPMGAKITALLTEVSQIVDGAIGPAKRLEAITKLEDVEKQMDKLCDKGNGRAAKALEYVEGQRLALTEAALSGGRKKKAK